MCIYIYIYIYIISVIIIICYSDVMFYDEAGTFIGTSTALKDESMKILTTSY